ncbi:MAG: OstA-like protein [Melioribacteraceae bacterium]|nr:OstA-like protein [Melioribacteraceae bacterium]
MITVLGDSLIGKLVNGESIREVHGNVVMTQGAVRITCSKAIQFIARNEAKLIGKVVVTQDSIIINTDLGYYYGDSKVAFSNSGVSLYDGHINLNSNHGYYYFDEKRAFFYDNVRLYDKSTNLESDRLTYFNEENKAVASGNVRVKDSTSVLLADSLVNFRNTKSTFAYKNVIIHDPQNRLTIFGGVLEDYDEINYTKIFDNPILIQIDTTKNGELDTLIISSKLMEAFNDSTKRLVASDSVKISRSGFASVNGITFYYQDPDHLFTYKREEDSSTPVLWNDNTQLIGDTVNIYLEENRMKKMLINSNSFIISTQEGYDTRFDQISGREIRMLFGQDGLEKTEVMGNVLSIYYLYEEDEPNGLLKSSSERANIFFSNNSVSEVKFYGNPASEYHPENLIEGKEKDFTIPSFIIIKNRPTKESILGERKNKIFSKLLELENYGK